MNEDESVVENPQVRGRKYELKVLKLLKSFGFKKLARTILVNKEADNKGIDIQPISVKVPKINIQCKSSSKDIKYPITLHNMPDTGAVNVIFHEKWWKGEIAGTYAILGVNDFLTLINK
jgi:hypothetical protein